MRLADWLVEVPLMWRSLQLRSPVAAKWKLAAAPRCRSLVQKLQANAGFVCGCGCGNSISEPQSDGIHRLIHWQVAEIAFVVVVLVDDGLVVALVDLMDVLIHVICAHYPFGWSVFSHLMHCASIFH